MDTSSNGPPPPGLYFAYYDHCAGDRIALGIHDRAAHLWRRAQLEDEGILAKLFLRLIALEELDLKQIVGMVNEAPRPPEHLRRHAVQPPPSFGICHRLHAFELMVLMGQDQRWVLSGTIAPELHLGPGHWRAVLDPHVAAHVHGPHQTERVIGGNDVPLRRLPVQDGVGETVCPADQLKRVGVLGIVHITDAVPPGQELLLGLLLVLLSGAFHFDRCHRLVSVRCQDGQPQGGGIGHGLSSQLGGAGVSSAGAADCASRDGGSRLD